MKHLEVNSLQKKVRAAVIRRHLQAVGSSSCVCFTCGNAAAALRAEGLEVVEVGRGAKADLVPARWFTYTKVASTFRGIFDATCGHLPLPLIIEIAQQLAAEMGDLERGIYAVPSGSGETILCLSIAYPRCQFVAEYGTGGATEYQKNGPLNTLVARLCAVKTGG